MSDKPQPVLQDQLQRYVSESENLRRENYYLRGMIVGMSTCIPGGQTYKVPAMLEPWGFHIILCSWHAPDGRSFKETCDAALLDSAPAPQAQEAQP